MLVFSLLGCYGMFISNKKTDQKTNKERWLKYTTYIIIVGLIIVSILNNFFPRLSSFIVFVCLIEIKKNIKSYNTPNLILIFVYSFLIFLYLSFSYYVPNIILLYIYIQVAVFDGFSQISGQLFGKNQLVSKISQNKTVEGLIGGILMCIIASILIKELIYISIIKAIILGIITCFFSLSGDILASYFKRLNNIKDFSNYLPGQGGFLDRFDSYIMTGSAYFIFYKFGIVINVK